MRRGLERAQDWLVAPAWYRVCGSFDFQADVEEFDMECTGLEGEASRPTGANNVPGVHAALQPHVVCARRRCGRAGIQVGWRTGGDRRAERRPGLGKIGLRRLSFMPGKRARAARALFARPCRRRQVQQLCGYRQVRLWVRRW